MQPDTARPHKPLLLVVPARVALALIFVDARAGDCCSVASGCCVAQLMGMEWRRWCRVASLCRAVCGDQRRGAARCRSARCWLCRSAADVSWCVLQQRHGCSRVVVCVQWHSAEVPFGCVQWGICGAHGRVLVPGQLAAAVLGLVVVGLRLCFVDARSIDARRAQRTVLLRRGVCSAGVEVCWWSTRSTARRAVSGARTESSGGVWRSLRRGSSRMCVVEVCGGRDACTGRRGVADEGDVSLQQRRGISAGIASRGR